MSNAKTLVDLVNYPSVKITLDGDIGDIAELRNSFKATILDELYRIHPELKDTLKELGKFTTHQHAWLNGPNFIKGLMYGYPSCCSASYGNKYSKSVERELAPNTTVYWGCPICRTVNENGMANIKPIRNRKVSWDSSSNVDIHNEVLEAIKNVYKDSEIICAWTDFAKEEAASGIAFLLKELELAGFTYTLKEGEVFQCSLPFRASVREDGRTGLLHGKLFVVNAHDLTERHLLKVNFVNNEYGQKTSTHLF